MNEQLDRRSFISMALSTSAVAAASLLLPRPLRADGHHSAMVQAALDAASKSPLIYVSPLQNSGGESTCHGEVWFAKEGDDLLVVTSPERWRAACIARGLTRARIWVGDHGVWSKSNQKFREAPFFVASARIEGDRNAHARALEIFGAKYHSEWSKWGPRFSKGLASGKRVMLRYGPA
jgi:hypothetical protein